MPGLTYEPIEIDGTLIDGEGREIVVAGDRYGWPAPAVLRIVGTNLEWTATVDGSAAVWTLTAEDVAAIKASRAPGLTHVRYQVTVGAGDTRRSVLVGVLVIRPPGEGDPGPRVGPVPVLTGPFGPVHVIIGPPGRSVASVSVDGDDLVFGMSDGSGVSLPVPELPGVAEAQAAAEAAEDARDAAQDIAQGATVDGAVAALVDDPDSATRAALSSTFVSNDAAQDARVVAPARLISVDSRSAFFVKGVNLGITGAGGTDGFWGASWDWSWVEENLDIAVQHGANVVRNMGSLAAYQANPAQYVSRVHQFFEAARDRGLKVLWAHFQGTSWPASNVSAWTAAINAVTAGYAGDPVIYGWDVGNELMPQASINADGMAVISALVPAIKAADPGTPVTVSIVQYPDKISTFQAREAIGLIDSLVDFHDIHLYALPRRTLFTPALMARFSAVATKPILLGEIGATAQTDDAAPAGSVLAGGRAGQAALVRSMQRYLGEPGLLGMMLWKAKDTAASTTKYGLVDSDGTPTQQASAFNAIPTVRLDAARQMLEFRPHPVIVDDFARAVSASSAGSPAIGRAAWVPKTGSTWGIVAGGGANIAVRSGGEFDTLTCDAGSTSTHIEAEFLLTQTSNMSCGVMWYADAATGYGRALQVVRHPTDPLSLWARYLNIGATVSYLSSAILTGATKISFPWVLRIGVTLWGDASEDPVFTVGGFRWTVPGIGPGASPTPVVGACIGSTDTTSVLSHFQAEIRGRSI